MEVMDGDGSFSQEESSLCHAKEDRFSFAEPPCGSQSQRRGSTSNSGTVQLMFRSHEESSRYTQHHPTVFFLEIFANWRPRRSDSSAKRFLGQTKGYAVCMVKN